MTQSNRMFHFCIFPESQISFCAKPYLSTKALEKCTQGEHLLRFLALRNYNISACMWLLDPTEHKKVKENKTSDLCKVLNQTSSLVVRHITQPKPQNILLCCWVLVHFSLFKCIIYLSPQNGNSTIFTVLFERKLEIRKIEQ